jgi:hypothetical protein
MTQEQVINQAAKRAFVPQGRSIIAQQFTAGKVGQDRMFFKFRRDDRPCDSDSLFGCPYGTK